MIGKAAVAPRYRAVGPARPSGRPDQRAEALGPLVDGIRVLTISPAPRRCAVLVQTADGLLLRCATPPAWSGTLVTTAGQAHAILVCEDHRSALELINERLLGCE
ncbi:MAG TPA: hypothetical protein VK891_06530 [Euzebyales bacterium]|nr:hypothetical protein [Euzebyales bacterium]